MKPTAKLTYVGSAAQTVALREATRFRKFQQVQKEKLVSVELSLRYWHRQDNFWEWAELLLGRQHATTTFLLASNGSVLGKASLLPATEAKVTAWTLVEFTASYARLRSSREGFCSLLALKPFLHFQGSEPGKKCGNFCVTLAATRVSGSKRRGRYVPIRAAWQLCAICEKSSVTFQRV